MLELQLPLDPAEQSNMAQVFDEVLISALTLHYPPFFVHGYTDQKGLSSLEVLKLESKPRLLYSSKDFSLTPM